MIDSPPPNTLTESSLRQAMLKRLEQRWRDDSSALLVEEFATHQGEARVDIAVVDGALWAYELKSAVDRLHRLPRQADAFSEVFDYAVLAVASRHLDKAEGLVPEWWGIIEGSTNTRGTVALRERRRAKRNPQPSPWAVAC